MSAAQSQVIFAAEFVLFLATVAGAAVVVLRPSLLVAGPARRWAMAAGFTALGLAGFLHGSLLASDAAAPAVVVPRLLGLGLLAAALSERRVAVAVWSLRLAVAVLVVAEVAVLAGADEAGVVGGARVVGAVLLMVTLLVVARESIPARVATTAAGTVLLVVLAVSITLSRVVVDNVQREALRRTQVRAAAGATDATRQPNAARVRATGVAELLVERARADVAARDLLLALAAAPSSPQGASAATQLAASLGQLGQRPDLFSVQGLLAFVTPNGTVVPGAGMPTSGSARAQLGLLGVVGDAISNREAQSAPEVLGRQLLAVAAAPVVLDTPDGPQFIGVVLIADRLDHAYLRANTAEEGVSATLVGRDGVLAHRGPQPAAAVLRGVAAGVLDDAGPASQTRRGYFVAAVPVLRGARPLAAFVASSPSNVVDRARQSLFRTLFVVALLAALGAIVFASMIGSRIGRGLHRLTSTAEEIRAGNLDVTVGLDQSDELGLLGTAFDRMAVSLRTMTDELREAAIDETRLRGRLEAVVGGMGEGLVAVDADGTVTDINDAALELFGVTAGAIRGEPMGTLSIAAPAGEDLTVRLARPTGGPWSSEATITHSNGARIPVAVTGAPLRGPTGERAGAVLVVRDVRREREVERMKTEFLANISHEMKTPLTPIKGYAELLATRDVSPEQGREFAAEIVTGARQLERVITQLVNFATMAAGRLEAHPAPVAADAVVDDLVERWSSRLGAEHVVEGRVTAAMPELLVDRRLLDLSLDELVDNAVKYSPTGGKVTITAAPGASGDVLVSVADDGVGVPDDQLELIFAEFAQADGSSTREFGGLGLGLSLVRHVALAHGGALTCESAPDQGSTFTLRLPAALP